MANSELFILKEGKVILPANSWFAERIIGDYDDANQEAKIT